MIGEMTEVEYRAIKKNSSSSLKDYLLDKRKYHKKHILGDTVKEKENKAANMGRLVETLLMEPERFDDLFFMSSLATVPTGLTGEFVYGLAQLISDNTDEETDELKGDFEDYAKKAYIKSGFKLKFETVLKKLEDSDIHIYYLELLKVMYNKMTMVTPQDIDNAEQIVRELQTNPNTSGIVNLEDGPNFSVFNQMKIDNYQIDGMQLKSMLDKVIVNHKTKQVHVIDLKCTWSVEKFYKEYYLFRRSYIQGYLYYKAVEYMANVPGTDFYGYEVLPTEFLVCDSINYYQPLRYQMNEKDLDDAYNGFMYKDTYYPGVKQIISELQWSIENDTWNISKANFDKNGILNIKD